MSVPPDRKAPCPCGSGKKYKSCCYARDAAATPAGQARDFRRVEGLLIDALATWSRTSSFDWLSEGVARLGLEGDDDALMTMHWAAFHAGYGALAGQAAARHWLAAAGAGAPAELRRMAEAQLAAWVGLWRVDAVEPGIGMALTDLLSGEVRRVLEAKGSLGLEPGCLLCGRVVDAGGISVLSGVHGASLPTPADPDGLFELGRLAREVLAGHGIANPTAEALRTEEATGTLLAFWETIVQGIQESARADDDGAETGI